MTIPRPIDASVTVVFNTGGQTGTNNFSVYFREAVVDYVTMIELNQYSMAELNGRPLPNQGDAKWEPRELATLEGRDIGEFEGVTMRELERQEDFDLLSNFRITVEWGITPGTSIYGLDSEGNGQTFVDVGDLANGTTYIALLEVFDSTWRVRIYDPNIDGIFKDTELVYDTGEINDDFHLKRRKGALRLAENLIDPTANVIEMRTRHLNFAEYRSKPMQSHTPVAGCQLFAEYTPGIEHFTGLLPGPEGGTVALDKGKSLSGESYKITNLGTDVNQGVQTNVIQFENFDNYRIEFDIWYPQLAIDSGNPVEFFLRNADDRLVKINLGHIQGDSWYHVKLYPVEGDILLTGTNQLYWRQAATGQATTWWLDNIKVIEESMRWEARAVTDDPWSDRKGVWTPFRDLVNSEHNGILFHERGTQLQVRGKALRQDVTLGKVKIKPKYAELGRIVFDQKESSDDLVQGIALPSMPQTTYTVDLGSTKKLDRVYIDWVSAPVILQFFGSTDNVTFTPICTQDVPAGTAGWKTYAFASKPTYRYLRISGNGGSFSWLKWIVRPCLVAPTANFTTSIAGATVTFNASSSADSDGFIIGYVWDFGDGAQGFGKNIKHTYAETGFGYNVRLLVIDNHGNETIFTQEVGV